MKYGLMYYKETDNIGDDIQTYVAKRFLPHIDYYIDREGLNCFIPKEKEVISVIMNGWFLHNKLAWPPSPYINPLLISMHFTSLEKIDVGEKYLQGIGGEYLKKYGKIGCRDIETQNRLSKNNIDNYFSGCMTLTIQPFESLEKKDYICLVDINESVIKKIESSTNREIKKITHSLNPEEVKNKSMDKRMEEVEDLLKTYQSAHLVITSRLHVALPCIALGTPVILITEEIYEKDRLETFLKYPSAHYTSKNFENMDIEEINKIIENPRMNNKEYLQIANNLINTCEEFIKKCESSCIKNEDLPEPEVYYNNYISKIEWYKNLHEDLRVKAKKNLYECDSQYAKYNNEISNLLVEKNKLIKENNELQEKINYIQEKNCTDEEKILNEKLLLEEELKRKTETLENIYNSKSWKILEKYRKIKKNLKKD